MTTDEGTAVYDEGTAVYLVNDRDGRTLSVHLTPEGAKQPCNMSPPLTTSTKPLFTDDTTR
jgi:hypothetical protein